MVCSLRCQHSELRNGTTRSPYPWVDAASLGCHDDLGQGNEIRREVAVQARIYCVACGRWARLAAVAAAQRKKSRQRSTRWTGVTL